MTDRELRALELALRHATAQEIAETLAAIRRGGSW